MLHYAAIYFVIAIISALFAFRATTVQEPAAIMFVLAAVVSVVCLMVWIIRRGRGN